MTSKPTYIPIKVHTHQETANHQGKTGIAGRLFKAKRRASQALREKIGSSKSLTTDLDPDNTYEPMYEELLKTEKEFDALGASFGRFAGNLEMWTHASRALAGGAHQFFTAASTRDSLAPIVDPSFVQNVTTFGKAAIEVDDNIRRHVTKEYMDHVLSPLKHVVVDQIPLLKQQHLERHGYERDVASYRRRLQDTKKLQTKAPTEKRAELLTTLESKLNAAEANFQTVDALLRTELKWVIDNKHTVVHKQMSMCMACYAEFYKRSHQQFQRYVL